MSSSDSSDSDTSDITEQQPPAPVSPSEDSDSAPSHRGEHSPPQQNSLQRVQSDSDEDDAPQMKKRVLASDDSDNEDGDAAKRNIFGAEVSSSDDEGKSPKRDKSESEGSIQGVRLYPDPDEEEVEEEDAAPNIIPAEAAHVEDDIASCNPIFIKFPNFLSVDTKPFDPDYYEENEDQDNLDAEGRNRLKLKVENTIRWRINQDHEGNEVKESNAKMVTWSDGTMSMYLGKEVFDVQVLPVHEQSHLYIRQGFGLSGQSVFTEKLNFRPHSTDSHTHRKVTLSMADRTKQNKGVKLTDATVNPDEVQRAAIKKEEEAIRAATRRENQQRRIRDRGRYTMTSSFLEGREDSDEESLNHIKKSFQRGGREYDAPLIGHSDSEEGSEVAADTTQQEEPDSDEEFRKKKAAGKKQIVTSDEDSD